MTTHRFLTGIFLTVMAIAMVIAHHSSESHQSSESDESSDASDYEPAHPDWLVPIVNSNLTKRQQEDEMLKIAKEHGGEMEKIITDEIAQTREAFEKIDGQIDKSNMTEAAKKAAHQICAIINNMDITPAESDRNINKILSEMTESDRKALDAFYDESMEPLINYLENIQFPALRKL